MEAFAATDSTCHDKSDRSSDSASAFLGSGCCPHLKTMTEGKWDLEKERALPGYQVVVMVDLNLDLLFIEDGLSPFCPLLVPLKMAEEKTHHLLVLISSLCKESTVKPKFCCVNIYFQFSAFPLSLQRRLDWGWSRTGRLRCAGQGAV